MRGDFRWSDAAKEAAELLGSQEFSLIEIAEKVGVSRQTLHNWRQNGEFLERVDDLRQATREEVRRHGIAIIERRVIALQDRWRRLQRVIEARGEDMAHIPGGETGLLVRRIKSIGSGPTAREVEEYAVDTGLLNELREHEKHAAQELGQWIGKSDVTTDGKPIGADVVLHFEDNGFGNPITNGEKTDPGSGRSSAPVQ